MRSSRHRAALAAIALFSGLGAAGCASTHVVSVSQGGSASAGAPTGTSAASPQSQAAQAANALLAAFDGLPGATRTSTGSPGETAGDLNAQWTVDSTSGAAFTAAEARLPHWPRAGSGTTQPPVEPEGPNGETVQTSGDGTLAQESVDVTTMPAGSGRSTLWVTVDVVWRPAKPAAERLPDTAFLTVSDNLEPASSSVTAGRAATLADRAKIAQIASEIDALPTEPHYGIVNCPMIRVGTVLRLEFRNSADGPPVAVVQVSTMATGMCGGSLTVSVGGAAQPSLDDAAEPQLAERIAGQAGLPLPDGHPTSR